MILCQIIGILFKSCSIVCFCGTPYAKGCVCSLCVNYIEVRIRKKVSFHQYVLSSGVGVSNFTTMKQ